MKRPARKFDPPRWRAPLVRERLQFLGLVYSRTREAAEQAAVEEFKLNDEQRKRLVLREQP
jgi:hypothetical protein